jgi:LuxR family maltose regulon positive regulatory protein
MDAQTSEPLQWLAKTKFFPPLLREDVIPRQRLLNDLHDGLASHPLTLLSAPAGYGKTTLLAALPATFPDLSLAWLSLDREDNDPVRFLTALVVALQHLNPACCFTAQTLLTGQASPGTEEWRVVSVLINDVLETLPKPFALILDDLHVVSNPAIFVALDYLLEHMPRQMHLVVATRVDPPLALARMRAREEVSELRLAALRFTNEEAMAFLNDRLGLGLAPEELAALQHHAEGWPVGLRLMAGSLERFPATVDRGAFIQHLMQTDRNVFNFLAEEVFNLQEPEVQAFLLETSILAELTPELCQAVTGRADAGTLLEDLLRRNVFLVETAIRPGRSSSPSLARQPSYRYHDLFTEFLSHKLNQEAPERVPELQLRAAQAVSDPSRAVGHYLAAASWPEAAAAIEQIGDALLTKGYFDTLSDWINALPAAVREAHPRLLTYLSQCAIWKGAWEEAESLMERALQGFEAAGDEAGQGEVLANLALIAAWSRSNFERSEALINQALAKPLPPDIRVNVLLDRASQKLTWGDWAQAERDFNAAMRIQGSGELDALHLIARPTLDPGFAYLPGGLEHLERICKQARAQVGDEVSPVRLVVEELTTILCLFRGQLVEAIRSGENALALRQRLGGHPFLAMDAAFFLIMAHAARGDYAALEPLFRQLFLGVRQTDQPAAHVASALFAAGRIRWLQACTEPFNAIQDRNDYLKEAREIYAQMCAAEDPQREVPADGISRAWMWSLLEMAEARYAEAEQALRRPEVLEQKDRYSTIFGSTPLMLARLYLQQKRQQEALAELSPVLAYHEQLGIPFAILLEGQSIVPLLRLATEQGVHERYAAYLLGLLGADEEPRPVRVPGTGATLTPREVEVLRLIVEGANNRTIGERLVIAESTVKTHVYHIFAKLDVSNRTEAAARGRELKLA